MKADKSANTIILENGDMQLITKVIAEAAQESFKTIEERQEEFLGTVIDFLKVLCKDLKMLKLL